jgi:hypothetical protein
VPVIGVMSTMISSPTSNLFDLLKEEPKPAKGKAAKPTPAKNQLSNEEKQRKRQEEDEQKKLEAALASQHQEEAQAEGFTLANASKDNKQNTRLSRVECMCSYFFIPSTFLFLLFSFFSRLILRGCQEGQRRVCRCQR